MTDILLAALLIVLCVNLFVNFLAACSDEVKTDPFPVFAMAVLFGLITAAVAVVLGFFGWVGIVMAAEILSVKIK